MTALFGAGPCRTAKQAASTLSKLPPHTLAAGGLDPATQSAANQQAYLGGAVQLETRVESAWFQRLRLKLRYDELLSNFAFKINLRNYTWAPWPSASSPSTSPSR